MNSVLNGSNNKSAHSRALPLQFSGSAERSHGKKREQQSDGDGDPDEPAGDVTRPRAQGGVEPSERKNGKDRRDNLMKKLAERTPEAPETAVPRRRSSARGR
jgi:hypothetical protein